ncbi:MAG: DUF917 family protein [Candidatus Aminicenantes bacterium]|nr:DUF917 family protein [Candidatus Aminicenantes bacterium]
MNIDRQDVEAAVTGGAILGGGGGGWVEEGRILGRLALEKGFSEILSIDDIPDTSTLLTVSAVGAPSAGASLLRPEDYVRAVELFMERTAIKVGGLISSEIGALGVVNGWLQSAALDIPVVDAPCNGRAHPLGLMGSMGLAQKKDYLASQAAVGGSLERGNRVESFFTGPLSEVSKKVRESAVRAGGMVAVARNPVPCSYVKEHGAPGAIRMALDAGKRFLEKTVRQDRAEEAIERILSFLGGTFIGKGIIEKYALKMEAGLDAGQADLREGTTVHELTFWNEYMTLEGRGKRIATFPDLIMTFDAQTGRPLTSAELRGAHEVLVIVVPARKLILGAGMRDHHLLRIVEKTIGKSMGEFGS